MINRRSLSKLNAILIAIAFTLLATQSRIYAACDLIAPPDDGLWIIPQYIIESYDFNPEEINLLHNYGQTSLAYLADTNSIPSYLLAEMTPLQPPNIIVYRGSKEKFTTPSSVSFASYKSGYYLVAIFGPSDMKIIDSMKATGLLILGSASPYGFLVKADGLSLQRAASLCTSEGYRIIRDVFNISFSQRMSPFLKKLADGEFTDFNATGVVSTSDGGIVIRVFPFNDENQSATLLQIQSYLQKPSPDISQGYEDAFIIFQQDIYTLLTNYASISYIEQVMIPQPSSNIAVQENALDIMPVWNNLGYDGKNIAILLNDVTGIDTSHKDFCRAESDCPAYDMNYQQPYLDKSIFKAIYPPNQAGIQLHYHGTHVAGILAGQGWKAQSTNLSSNQCLCRPRAEEEDNNFVPSTSPICGDVITGEPNIYGVAKGADLLFRYDAISSDLIGMMDWGYSNAYSARISSQSWHLDYSYNGQPAGSGSNADDIGEYNAYARTADGLVRDARNDGTKGIDQMTIVFAAGNNDQQDTPESELWDTDPHGWVKTPATAKNIISVGATENARCSEARHYTCAEYQYKNADQWTCKRKVPIYPDINHVYERSTFGPVKGTETLPIPRIKPDIMAIGSDVLATQASNEHTLWTHECTDCRKFCDSCTECSTSTCSYKVINWNWSNYGARCSLGGSFCQPANVPGGYINFMDDTWTTANYQTMSGTSMAAPMIAGSAAIFHQFYKANNNGSIPSPALTKAALINGAKDMSTNNNALPYLKAKDCALLFNEDVLDHSQDTYFMRKCLAQGWGRLDLKRSIKREYGSRIIFHDENPLLKLKQGDLADYYFKVVDPTVDIKITLVWTDLPGNAGCKEDCLQNDLDMLVSAPVDPTTGLSNTYRGNIFQNTGADFNYSLVNPGSQTDAINNVESVVVKNPSAGEWRVRVKATNIKTDSEYPNWVDVNEAPYQDFALVYSGGLCEMPHTRPVTPPAAIDLDVSSDTGILLSWAPPLEWGDDSAGNDRTYQIERNDQLLSVALRSTSTDYIDNPSSKNQPIKYQIRYLNSCQMPRLSPKIAAIDNTAGAPQAIPAISTVIDYAPCVGGIFLSWNPEAGYWNGTKIGYEVWRDGEKAPNINRITYGDSPAVTDFPPTDVEVTYQIRYISLIDGVERSNFSPAISIIDQATGVVGTFSNRQPANNTPSAPINVLLDWDDAPNATTYDLYFGTTCPPTTPTPYQANIPESQFDMTGLASGTQYCWYVVAKNACGSSSVSGATWHFTTGPSSCQLPTLKSIGYAAADLNDCAYTGVKITFPWEANDQISNSWGDSNQNKPLRSYFILRKRVGASNYKTVATMPYHVCFSNGENSCETATQTFIDETAHTDWNYLYKIRYVNSCGGFSEHEITGSKSDGKSDPPEPSISSASGKAYNICPEMTVTLTTQAGMSGYQWMRDGAPVCTNTATCMATQSGRYTVSYSSGPGCIGTSVDGFDVTISPCPDIHFVSATLFPEPGEDTNAVFEAGEMWDLAVTIKNDGSGIAEDVMATLAENTGAVIVFNKVGVYGSLDGKAVGFPAATATYTYRIMADPAIWYSANACGSTATFSIVGITAGFGAYPLPNLSNMINLTVGQLSTATTETSTAANTGNATNGNSQPSAFDKAFTVLGGTYATSATLKIVLAGTSPDIQKCGAIFLEAPGGAMSTIKNFGGTLPGDNSYNVLNTYRTYGPGTYKVIVGEKNYDVSCTGYIYGKGPNATTPITMIVSATTAPACNIFHKIATNPDEGTSAGATTVKVSGPPGTFDSSSTVYFDLDNKDCSATANCHLSCYTNKQPAIVESVSADGRYLMIRTKGVPEGQNKAGVFVQNAVETKNICQQNAFDFKTLAFTTNMLSGDISVLDTKYNQPFDVQPRIQIPSQSILYGLALAKDPTEQVPGRRLLAADYGTGNLQIFDATTLNPANTATVTLQDNTNPDQPYVGYGAVDVAIDSDYKAYVAHMTAGFQAPLWNRFGTPWNPQPGGISIVNLATNQLERPYNDTSSETSPGAPPGERRIEAPNFYPYTISILNMQRAMNASNWAIGDGYPGEYAFVSGVGPQPPTPIGRRCTCHKILPPHEISICSTLDSYKSCCGSGTIQQLCIMRYQPRPMRIGIIDLNPHVVSDLPVSEAHLDENANYQRYIGDFDPGYSASNLGVSDQGLDFYSSSDGSNATVYAVNPAENTLYYFDFLTAVRNPASIVAQAVSLACTDASGQQIGCYPTDVKVQSIGTTPYAFVTNSSADSIASFQIALSTTEGQPSIPTYATTFSENSCTAQPVTHFPVSIDTRLKERSGGFTDAWGYVADYGSASVTAVNFSQNTCETILAGLAPFRIVVQPVPTAKQAYQAVKYEMVYAQPADFTQPAQQTPLITQWENIQNLQETNASPQAVLSAITNFQRDLNRWITNATLGANLNNGVDTYRAVYLQQNALPGQP